AAVNPVLVESQEPVLVPDLFGRDETEARVVKVEARLSGRELEVRRSIDRLAVNPELLDDRRRRLLVRREALRVYRRHALDGREPEPPPAVAPSRRVAAAAALARRHAVGRPVDDRA